MEQILGISVFIAGGLCFVAAGWLFTECIEAGRFPDRNIGSRMGAFAIGGAVMFGASALILSH